MDLDAFWGCACVQRVKVVAPYAHVRVNLGERPSWV